MLLFLDMKMAFLASSQQNTRQYRILDLEIQFRLQTPAKDDSFADFITLNDIVSCNTLNNHKAISSKLYDKLQNKKHLKTLQPYFYLLSCQHFDGDQQRLAEYAKVLANSQWPRALENINTTINCQTIGMHIAMRSIIQKIDDPGTLVPVLPNMYGYRR